MIQPNLINLHPNEYGQGSCYTLKDLCNNYVFQAKQKI